MRLSEGGMGRPGSPASLCLRATGARGTRGLEGYVVTEDLGKLWHDCGRFGGRWVEGFPSLAGANQTLC